MFVFSNVGFPLSATDPIDRQMQAQRAEVLLVDVHPEDAQRAPCREIRILSRIERQRDHRRCGR